MRVSIVIPVYNEESYLQACLEAVERQTVKPFEVIVVDNNSTDGSAAIASSFPFVKLIRQPRQGVVHARDVGFDAARGDIIGRIDGDSCIAPDWVASVQALFSDPTVAAATGKVHYYGSPLNRPLTALDWRIRRTYAWLLDRELPLQGANMAMRRSVWGRIRSGVCRQGGMHEDFDLAVHVNQSGGRVVLAETMKAHIRYRLFEAPLRQVVSYVVVTVDTYARHGLTSQRYMYPVMALILISALPLRFLHRGYNPATKRFSFVRAIMVPGSYRVNPATYVD